MMNDKFYTIQAIREQVTRFVNQFNKLEKIPFDVGNGDLLYPSEMNMIEAIGKNIGNTVTDLCTVFGVTKGAVSQIISKLSSKGYVEKTRNESNAKEVLLALTPKGRAVYDKHERFHEAMDKELEEFVSRYPSEKMGEFREMLSVMSKHVEKYIDLKNKKI